MFNGRILLLSCIIYSANIYSNESKKLKPNYIETQFKEAFDIVLDSDCSDISKDIESICRCIDTKNKYTFNTIVKHTDSDPNEWFRETLLECAIRVKKNGFIKPLIERGANATEVEQWTRYNVMTRNNEVIKITTPLHYAICCKNFSAALDLVKHHNADISIKDDQGRVPLFALCNTQHKKSKESSELLEELLRKGKLDPLYVDINGFTCIDEAARNLNCHMLAQLINHGAVPDATGQISTLAHAGERVFLELEEWVVAPVVITLLRAGTNPYIIDKEYNESFFKSLIGYDYDSRREAYHTWRSNLKLSHRMFKQNAYAGTLQWNRSESKEREEWVDLPFLPIKIINNILDYAVPWSKQICDELRKKCAMKQLIKQAIAKSISDGDADATNRIQALVLSDQESLPSLEVVGCSSVEVWVSKHIRRALLNRIDE